MIRVLSICGVLTAFAVLALPGLAPAQTKEIQDATTAKLQEAKLQQLEAKLQALLAEIKSLRAAPSTPAAPAAAHKSDGKPLAIKVTVDGDKVTIVDAATGKEIDPKGAFKLWSADNAKPGERKTIVIGDDKKGGDAKVERRVIVLEDGKEKKGEKKVFGIEELKGKTGDIELEFKVGPDGKVEKSEKKVVIGELKAKSGDDRAIELKFKTSPDGVVVDASPSVKVQPTQPKPATATWVADPAKPETVVRSYFAAGGSDNTVMLSRTTYTLPAEKAKALEAFLKEHAKTKVLETKLDGEKFTVTTTPEVQSTIGALVNMMTGKSAASGASSYRMMFTPATPAAPKAPTPPTKPSEPKKPDMK